MQAAIFLDRDGVIIENRADYVRNWEDVLIYPQALKALARISSQPYLIVLITNQSAIGRGLISLADAEQINRRLSDLIEEAGGRIDAVFMCPHAPWAGCNCRKPLPGLFHLAAEALDLDLKRSILVGDATSDLLAGRAAGIGTLALVRTGRGADQVPLLASAGLEAVPVYADLASAFADLFP